MPCSPFTAVVTIIAFFAKHMDKINWSRFKHIGKQAFILDFLQLMDDIRLNQIQGHFVQFTPVGVDTSMFRVKCVIKIENPQIWWWPKMPKDIYNQWDIRWDMLRLQK